MLAIIAASLMLDMPSPTYPLKPIARPEPFYPAACMPPNGEVAPPQRVVVAYTVNSEGLVERPHVRESTHPCFNDVALSAVRRWVFDRAVEKDRDLEPVEMETTVNFILGEPVRSDDIDARPKRRTLPAYPHKCMGQASELEAILIQFDVSASGKTENVRALEASNSCLVAPALASVRKWTYEPKMENGMPVGRKGVQTRVTFELSGYGERAYTPSIRKALSAVNAAIVRGDEPKKILRELEDLEGKYDGDFTSVERSTFFRLRGATRLTAGDYRGALDDLKIAARAGIQGQAVKSTLEMISRLEAHIAAVEAVAGNSADSQKPDEGSDIYRTKAPQ